MRLRAADSVMDLGNSITGTIPLKVVGHVGDSASDEGMSVEADLTPVKIDGLLPGWVKPAGRPARATYMMVKDAKSASFRRSKYRWLWRDRTRLGRI